MKHNGLIALALCVAGMAHAQESNLGVSVGVKAWNTQWTTFSYDTSGTGSQVLTQVAARDKVVFVPQLSLRYRDFVGSLSAFGPTNFEFIDGGSNRRKEFDANIGYFVLPGVAVTLGYKKLEQTGEFSYKPRGPVVGLSATAPLGGAFTLYGAFGLGRMKTPSSTNVNDVQFDADYRLTELGLAYNMPIDRVAKTLSFTVGYRTQVMSSKEALGSQDGRDLTQGLTFGLVAAF